MNKEDIIKEFRDDIYGEDDALFDRAGNNISTQVENWIISKEEIHHWYQRDWITYSFVIVLTFLFLVFWPFAKKEICEPHPERQPAPSNEWIER